jgi:hypothetical protein
MYSQLSPTKTDEIAWSESEEIDDRNPAELALAHE